MGNDFFERMINQEIEAREEEENRRALELEFNLGVGYPTEDDLRDPEGYPSDPWDELSQNEQQQIIASLKKEQELLKKWTYFQGSELPASHREFLVKIGGYTEEKIDNEFFALTWDEEKNFSFPFSVGDEEALIVEIDNDAKNEGVKPDYSAIKFAPL